MIFINQVTGVLFADVVDVLKNLSDVNILITGNSVKTWKDVRLISAPPLNKMGSFKRILSWSAFCFKTFWSCLLNARKQKQYLVFVTNPPINIWIAPFFKWLYGCPYAVIIYDIYPDVLVASNVINKSSLIAFMWKKLNAFTLLRADLVITLNQGMSKRIQQQLPEKSNVKIYVIENWVDTEFIKPIQKAENPLIIEQGFEDKFLVSYAGSFGATHGVEIILECAEMLKGISNIHFLLVGGGTEEVKIKTVLLEKKLTNVSLLPFQSENKFKYVAAAPDVSLILIKSGIGNFIMPSKLQTALSAGCAVIASAEDDSDLALNLKKNGYGVLVPPENQLELHNAILFLYNNPEIVYQYKVRARIVAKKYNDKKSQCAKYLELFKDLA